jgi:acetyltransferase-like isoleucine patch superfamily enzyme
MGNHKIRKFVLLFCLFYPNWLKLFLYRKLLRWKIGKGVRIGLSWIDAEHVNIGDNVKIGHLNVFRNLRQLELGASSYILNHNTVTAGLYSGWSRSLRIGAGTGIMSGHFFDASGDINISDHAVIAGRSTQIWTHEKKGGEGGLVTYPVHVGPNTYVAASVLIAPGVSIGAFCVVALGCVVKKNIYEDHVILIGNPTQVKHRKSIEVQLLGV